MAGVPVATSKSKTGSNMITKTETGTIKFFLVSKGYGFIVPDGAEGNEDKERFFHHTQLCVLTPKDKYKSIPNGTRVSYIPITNDKGLAAMNVTPI